MPQEAVAQRLGRHQQFVSKYESGERRLDIVELVDVAAALAIDPMELVDLVTERRDPPVRS